MYEREREIARQRASALLSDFNDPGNLPPPINLPPDLIAPNARRWGCTQTVVPGYRADEAVILLAQNDPLRSSVWATRAVQDHVFVFKQFLIAAYDIPNPVIPPELDVDHLRAKATAAPSSLIRLEMVGLKPNRSHGAGFEKRMAGSAVNEGRMRRGHTPGSMSWLAALKLAGIHSPVLATSKNHDARRKAAIDYFTRAGWPRHQVEEGLGALELLADSHQPAQ